MKTFRFRLQRILDTKVSEEREKKRELGEAQKQLTREEDILSGYHEDLKTHKELHRKVVKKSPKVADLVLNDRWRRQLQAKIRVQGEVVKKSQLNVEEKRAVLIEVSREKKVLERLRSKRFDEHKKEELSEEQKTFDEVGSRSHLVKSKK